jgi:Na+-driven multidrug efflux pump
LESGELVQGGTWGADLKDIVQLAGPAILQLSFQQAVIVTNQSMAGDDTPPPPLPVDGKSDTH